MNQEDALRVLEQELDAFRRGAYAELAARIDEGSIDDGGWRALVPLTRSFIKSADGRFVGE